MENDKYNCIVAPRMLHIDWTTLNPLQTQYVRSHEGCKNISEEQDELIKITLFLIRLPPFEAAEGDRNQNQDLEGPK